MEGKAGGGGAKPRNMRAFDSFRLSGASADTAEVDELKGQFDLLSEGRAVIRADDIRKASGRRGSVVNELSSLLTECQALRDGMNFEMFSSVMTQRQASTSIAGDNEMLAMFVSYDQGRCSLRYASVHVGVHRVFWARTCRVVRTVTITRARRGEAAPFCDGNPRV